MDNIETQIKSLLHEGQTGDALEALNKFFIETDSKYQDDLLVLIAENEENNRKKHTNSITDQNFQINRNRINRSLLGLTKKTKKPSALTVLPNPLRKSFAKVLPMLFLFGTLVIAAILVFTIAFFIPDSQNGDANDPIKTETSTSSDVDFDAMVDEIATKDIAHAIISFDMAYVNGVDNKKSEARSSLESLTKNLSYISDDSLQLHSVINKHYSLAMSYCMLALLSQNKTDQKELAELSSECAKNAIQAIDDIKTVDDIEYKKALTEFFGEEKYDEKIEITSFIASAVDFLAGGSTRAGEISERFSNLDVDLIKEDGFHLYPIIQNLESQNLISLK